jgi:hypothetical protein
LILLAAGFAVWTKRGFGWTLTFAISVIGLVASIAALAIQSALSIVGLVSNIGILFFMRKSVKAFFGRDSDPPHPDFN